MLREVSAGSAGLVTVEAVGDFVREDAEGDATLEYDNVTDLPGQDAIRPTGDDSECPIAGRHGKLGLRDDVVSIGSGRRDLLDILAQTDRQAAEILDDLFDRILRVLMATDQPRREAVLVRDAVGRDVGAFKEVGVIPRSHVAAGGDDARRPGLNLGLL